MRGGQDPYRELGVPRGATDEQVKAAHRRLAKRYHPDGADGDQARFLAVQEAYLLLSDPIRRRDWDSRHAPGPVRATERPVAPRREGPARPPASSAAPPARPAAAARPTGAPPTSASGRDPGVRSTTWSASGVPWWEDFRADGVRRGSGPASGAQPPANAHPGTAANGVPPPPSTGPGAGDIYPRSSGAAWSSAARRHFRKDDSDLPRGGQFRYRGTQVVTGARRHARMLPRRRAARWPSASSITARSATAGRPAQPPVMRATPPAEQDGAWLPVPAPKLLGGELAGPVALWHTCRHDHPLPDRAQPDGAAAHRHRPDGAVQHPLRAPSWRHVHPAPRGHGRRPLHVRVRARHPRGAAVAGHRLGRGTRRRRPRGAGILRAVSTDAASRLIPDRRRELARPRTRPTNASAPPRSWPPTARPRRRRIDRPTTSAVAHT